MNLRLSQFLTTQVNDTQEPIIDTIIATQKFMLNIKNNTKPSHLVGLEFGFRVGPLGFGHSYSVTYKQLTNN
jgi:hypothetical protein